MPKVRSGQSRPRRLVRWSLVVLALSAVALAAVYAWQARTAYLHLTSAQQRVPELRESVLAGDREAAAADAAAFAEDTAAARTAVAGPHWSALSVLPWVGPNVDAVQTVTEAVDDLAADGLPAMLKAAAALDPASLAPREGRIRLGPVEAAGPWVTTAHREAARAAKRLRGIDTEALHEQLRGPVADLSGVLAELDAQTATAATVAELLPAMLGADGPRHYLVLTQNPAEPRALGGIPGAVILLRADHGRIELLEQRPAASFGNTQKPVLPLTRAERTLYGTQLGRYMQNVTATPDFPRAARLAQAMWRHGTGRRVDGVATLDPYALQLLLRAVGPVDLPGELELTGDNAARVLLNQVYRLIPDPRLQDQFFASAAAAIFERVMSGEGDLRATAGALAEAVRQGRVMLWSAHGAEQRLIAQTAVSGRLLGVHDGHPVVGVYLHDRTAAKIGFYQDLHVRVRPTSCEANDPAVTVTVRLRSRVPRDIATFPDYLTGGGSQVPVGHIKSDVLLYAPPGARIAQVRRSDGPTRVTTAVHDGRFVARQTLDLAPGSAVRLRYDLVLDAASPGGVEVRTTPGPADGRFTASATQCDK